MQYIQGGGMVPGKPEYQNSYMGKLWGQRRIMCTIKIMESIVGSTTLVVNVCNNISALKWSTIHPEAVELTWKQVDLISRLSDVYQSMDSGMYLVHVHRHQNSGIPESTLIPLAYLNIQLDTIAEHIMAEFLISSVRRNKMAIGL